MHELVQRHPSLNKRVPACHGSPCVFTVCNILVNEAQVLGCTVPLLIAGFKERLHKFTRPMSQANWMLCFLHGFCQPFQTPESFIFDRLLPKS